jgi:hypothetical protein
MSVSATAVSVIPSLLRIHRQLRILNQSYMEAESKNQVQSAVEAKLDELQAVHDLLPTDLRDKSWILMLQGYSPWGNLSKS